MGVFNALGYTATAVGNHDYDWGQAVLGARQEQAVFPFLSANIVTGDPAGWTPPPGISPYYIKTIGEVKIAFIGVTTQETAVLNLRHTAGLTFKDPAESIIHYYDTMKAEGADVIVVLSHLGYFDGGYGIGLPVYGDQTLARRLNSAAKPVHLILGGHGHTNLTAATVVGSTTVAAGYYNGRTLGQADVTVNTNGTVQIVWSKITVSTAAADPTISGLVNAYATDPAYLNLINQPIAWTSVPILRNYNGDSLMGAFINDAVYNDLNQDSEPGNDVDLVLNNAGNFRADLTNSVYPYQITYGSMFTVLPFGNQTVVGTMTGAQIMDLLEQSTSLFKGALQPSGLRYECYRYVDATSTPDAFAWGAYNVRIRDKADGCYKPLELTKTYRVATNEFLAPSGGDGFTAFQGMTNITYWGDMLDHVNHWIASRYTLTNPYARVLDGRISWDGVDAAVSVGKTTVPLDSLKGFTEETNAANLQADAAVSQLRNNGVTVDFYLGGASRNYAVAAGASAQNPYTLSVRDLYNLMPNDDQLVVLLMNGPQIKAILERAYRNYYYYKYVPGYGGYNYYTAGMLTTSAGCQIIYHEAYPAYSTDESHVVSLKIGGKSVNLDDASVTYRVATMRRLALGGVNFNNSGVSLWPVSKMTADTRFTLRNAVMNHIRDAELINPVIAKRLKFTCKVTFNSLGGSSVAPAYTEYDALITKPANPTKAGYTFLGWFKESGLINKWDFATNKVSGDMALYAGWIQIPVNFKVASTTYNSAQLSWSTSTGAAGYEVWRKLWSTGTFALVASPTVTTLNDSGLSTGKTYYYKVRAYRLVNAVKVYSQDSAFISAAPIPAAPTNLKAASTGYTSTKITWTAVAGANGYEVYRKLWSSGTFALVASPTTGSWNDSGLSTGKTYYYKVRAYRLVGSTKVYGKDSAVVSAVPVPSAPTGLTAVSGGSKTAKIAWSSVAGASGYEVYRKTWSSGTYALIASPVTTNLINSGLSVGKTYYYKVRAYRLVGSTKIFGPESSAVTFTPAS